MSSARRGFGQHSPGKLVCASMASCTVHHKKIPRPFPHPGRHSYGLGTAVALRVAFADFSATPWQGFEKSECGPNNSSLFLPQAVVVVVALGCCLRCFAPPPCSNPPACVSLLFVQKKNARVFLHKRSLGGRGWIARAAHLKKPRRGFFAAGTDGGGRCCSNPPATIP